MYSYAETVDPDLRGLIQKTLGFALHFTCQNKRFDKLAGENLNSVILNPPIKLKFHKQK